MGGWQYDVAIDTLEYAWTVEADAIPLENRYSATIRIEYEPESRRQAVVINGFDRSYPELRSQLVNAIPAHALNVIDGIYAAQNPSFSPS